MLKRCILAENRKLHASPIWAMFFVLPILSATYGTFNYLQNLEILTDGPGAFDINAYGESFRYQTLVDENLTGKLTGDAATLIHMMNTNTFCSAVMELKNAGEASSFAEVYKEIVQGNHWMCGFPDTLVVLSLGNFVLTAYGADDLIQLFKSGAQSLGATLLVEAPAEA